MPDGSAGPKPRCTDKGPSPALGTTGVPFGHREAGVCACPVLVFISATCAAGRGCPGEGRPQPPAAVDTAVARMDGPQEASS